MPTFIQRTEATHSSETAAKWRYKLS